MTPKDSLPHLIFIIARGEAVRNFLYSETLASLRGRARVTLLSAINDEAFLQRFRGEVDEIIELKEYAENKFVRYLREIIDYAHYRWLWSEKVKNKWEILDSQAAARFAKIRHAAWKAIIFCLANRFTLNLLTRLENFLSLWLNPTRDFDDLFARLQPDLVFNTSHIHAPRGELSVRVAHRMGIRTAAFIFSWDNLSSRGRVLPPYDDYLVWHEAMAAQLRHIYPAIPAERVHVTGTPQFDFHFQPRYLLPRGELCRRLGLDSTRPFILYTTGMDRDFPEEARHVTTIIRLLRDFEPARRPQLVVRTYIKGTSAEMKSLAQQNIPDVVFPPILWDAAWLTPHEEDLSIYTSLLHHCALGINPASTVSLELMMLDKPVVNLGFDPPDSHLPRGFHWKRHIDFDHYQTVVRSSAVTVASSVEELRDAIRRALERPEELREARRLFIASTFGGTLDGHSARRAAEVLLKIALH